MIAVLIAFLFPGGELVPGRHNTDPITACINYNPGQLTLTGGPSGGAPPYVLQWQLASSAAGPWSDITGAAVSVFDPENLTEPGTWCFSCLVTDSLGATARTVAKVITIVPDPMVNVSGGGMFCPGAPVILTGEVTGGTGLIKYQWYFSMNGLTGWFPVAGATSALFSAPTGTSGMYFYRLKVDATGSACSKPWSAVLAVLAADTSPPVFTAPAGPLCFCVEPVAAAGYNPGNEIVESELPDYCRLNGTANGLDPDTLLFADDCCLPDGLVLHWRLEFHGGNPASISGTGPPSAGLAGVRLPGDGTTFQTLTHILTYSLEDCHGNLSAEQSITLVVRPRPQINF